tara:strand:+ start:96 stop:623 length:528 start_codon:yes stop_codon:yes gene_type:complete
MAYFLGRDVSVVIKAGDDVGVTSAGALAFDDTGVQFADTSGITVTDLTGVDLGIGVMDEDVTYMGSRTVLKAEIKKETTVTLTRKKKDNVWDVVFNGGARHGAASNAAISSLVQPDTTSATSYGYQLLITLKASEEVFKIPNAVMTAHTVTLNADGTTEETCEFMSNEEPVIATS